MKVLIEEQITLSHYASHIVDNVSSPEEAARKIFKQSVTLIKDQVGLNPETFEVHMKHAPKAPHSSFLGLLDILEK